MPLKINKSTTCTRISNLKKDLCGAVNYCKDCPGYDKTRCICILDVLKKNVMLS